MAEQTLVKPEAENAMEKSSKADIASTRDTERYLAPPVDIYETEDELVVLVDMPGVDKEDIDINVERGVLNIEGKTHYGVPQSAIHREFGLVNYFRQFELSQHVDQSNITGELKHGVLTIHVPKAEQAKPRQIEVKMG